MRANGEPEAVVTGDADPMENSRLGLHNCTRSATRFITGRIWNLRATSSQNC